MAQVAIPIPNREGVPAHRDRFTSAGPAATRQPNTVFRGAFESMAVGMALVSLDGHWLEVNRAFCELVGYTEAELLASRLDYLLHPSEPACAEWQHLSQGDADHCVVERLLVCRDGRSVSAQLTFSVVRDALDQARYCTVQVQDLTERKAVEAELRESEARFRALADSAPVLIWMADPSQACHYFNKAWLDFTGRSLGQEQGSGWLSGLHPEDRPTVVAAFAQALEDRESFEVEFRLRRHDGQDRWLLNSGAPRFDCAGRFAGYIGTCIDITERKVAQIELQELLTASGVAQAELVEQARRLHRLADSDPLTGVLNRRSFRDEFKREWAQARRYDRTLACIMLDIDFFKRINDAHGHSAGDAVLKRLAEILVSECRPSDRVCRYGGEEFCIMAPETDEDGAVVLGERLRTALAAERITLGDNVLCITSSLGVAERTLEMDDPEQLIERADRALYIAKHSGRNRVVRFASEASLAELTTRDNPLRILSHVTAGDLAAPVIPIRADATVAQAVETLLAANLEAAPMVDAAGKLIGFVSERDLMTSDVSAVTWARPVREVVKSSVVCYERHRAGHQVYQMLCRVSIRQVAVVRDGVPVGMITPGSLLRFVQQHATAVIA